MFAEGVKTGRNLSLPQVLVLPQVLALIEAEARRFEFSEQETGGIMVAKVVQKATSDQPDTVLILAASGAGNASFHHSVEFELDANHANQELERLRGIYPESDFVGIWHKHPPSLARPSGGDYQSARRMLLDPEYTAHGLLRLINPIVVLRNGKFIINFFYLDLNCKDFVALPFEIAPKNYQEEYRRENSKSASSGVVTVEAREIPTAPAKGGFSGMVAAIIGVVMLLVVLVGVVVALNSSNQAVTPTQGKSNTPENVALATKRAENEQVVAEITARARELNTAIAAQTIVASGTPALAVTSLDGFKLKVKPVKPDTLQNIEQWQNRTACKEVNQACLVVKVTKPFGEYLANNELPPFLNFEWQTGNGSETVILALNLSAPDRDSWYGVAVFASEQSEQGILLVNFNGRKLKSDGFEIKPGMVYLAEVS
jgi:hypothetical protein